MNKTTCSRCSVVAAKNPRISARGVLLVITGILIVLFTASTAASTSKSATHSFVAKPRIQSKPHRTAIATPEQAHALLKQLHSDKQRNEFLNQHIPGLKQDSKELKQQHNKIDKDIKDACMELRNKHNPPEIQAVANAEDSGCPKN